MGGIGRAMNERKRGPNDDDDSGVNTARSSGQSATKATKTPEEKSHLSLLRLFSSSRSSLPTGSLFPPHAWPPSHRRARACI